MILKTRSAICSEDQIGCYYDESPINVQCQCHRSASTTKSKTWYLGIWDFTIRWIMKHYFIAKLTGSLEDSHGHRLHVVTDRRHGNGIVPARLKLIKTEPWFWYNRAAAVTSECLQLMVSNLCNMIKIKHLFEQITLWIKTIPLKS